MMVIKAYLLQMKTVNGDEDNKKHVEDSAYNLL